MRRKHKGAGKEQVQPSSSRYASDYSWNSYPFFFRVFVSEYSYIVDWCGRKGPQIVVLRSVPDVYYTLIRILLSLILLLIPKHRLYQYECHDD